MKIEDLAGTKAHQRYRLMDGTIVPGVTTIVGILNKPALVTWANKLGLEGIDVNKYVDKTAVIGTLAHYLVQCYLSNSKPSLDEYPPDVIDRAENSLIKFWEWEKNHAIEPLKLEEQLVSEKHKYGGTIDCLCRLNGKLTLIDFKTGKAIFDEMIIQVSAYRQLLIESGFKVEQVHILRIGRDQREGFEDRLISNGFLDIQWEIFKHLLEIYYLRSVKNVC